MITIVYASRATAKMDDEALRELLASARARNAEDGVTGMLIYAHGSFLQQIEGAERPVDAIFSRIRRDPRHRDLRLLSRRRIAQRSYEGWAMGFELPNPEGLAARVPGYRSTFKAPLVNPHLICDTEIAETVLELCATGGTMSGRGAR